MPTPNNLQTLYGNPLFETKLEELETKTTENKYEIKKLKSDFENLKKSTDDNINIAREISLQNERFKIILENNVEMMKDTRTDMKQLKTIVEKINVDTSKNTDTRLNGKQITISVIVAVIMLLIGAGLNQSGRN